MFHHKTASADTNTLLASLRRLTCSSETDMSSRFIFTRRRPTARLSALRQTGRGPKITRVHTFDALNRL